MSNVYDAGKVIIVGKKVALKKFSGSDELNIYSQVSSFDIFEDLDNYTVTADFYITDGIELINNYPLGGEETIEVTIQTPSRGSITYNFMINAIQNMKTNDSANLRSYVLRCVTKDFLKNSSMSFTKRYTDMKYDIALATLLNVDMSAGTPLATLEQTKGHFDYVVNNKRPFQIIDIIKERAVSQKYLSSVFVFYQDNQGYHFQTIEKLINDRKAGAAGKKYEYRTGNKADFKLNVNAWEILSYEVMSQGQQAEKTKKGAMRNQYREFDIFRGTYFNTQEYINISDHGSYTAIDQGIDLNSPDFNAFTQQLPSVTRMAVTDTLRPEMEHNKNLHYQRPFIERMTQQGVRIRVYGNTDIKVGDIVQLNLPEISGLSGRAPKKVEIFSNNYMITALKHRCDKNEANEFVHTMVYELRKPDQFGKSLG
jgi:hypothetical protein